MELEAAKMIGAGLAAIALAGAGVGIGIIFGNYLSGAMRNPSAAQKQFPNLLLGFDLLVANDNEVLKTIDKDITKSIVNSDEVMTGNFTRDKNFSLPFDEPPLELFC